MKKIFVILLALIFLAPVASGNAGVLFEDDFEDGNRNGWTHIDSDEGPAAGQWIVVYEPSKGYVLEGTASSIPQYLKLDLPDLPDRFILEFEAKTVLDGGTSASLFAFYVPWLGWGDGYIGVHRYRPTQSPSFRINQSGLNCVEGNTSPQDTSITPYQWHTFKFVKDENWYTFYYDNNVVFQGWVSTDSSCTDLGGHLVLGTSRSNVTRFDNIRISTISDEITQYTVTDLGIPEGDYTWIYGRELNEQTQVVGTVAGVFDPAINYTPEYAFIWDPTSGFTVLPTLGGVFTEAMGVNDFGLVVGGSRVPGPWGLGTHAVIWEDGAIIDLGGGSAGRANAVNNAGQVVGWYGSHASGAPFIWDSTNGMEFPFGPYYTYPWAINDLGQVVGHANDANGQSRDFIWDAINGQHYLALPNGYQGGNAWDINNSSQIVGFLHTVAPPNVHHPVFYDNGVPQVLAYAQGSATAINDNGKVVGAISDTYGGPQHAFIWDKDNGRRDLYDLVIPGHGFDSIVGAQDINNAGQILATARIGDESHMVLLTPICEPNIIWDLDTTITVLTPEGDDTWESNQLWYPRVMYEGGEYKMWYAGTPGYSYIGRSGIGYATSLDGVEWADRQRVHGPETQPSYQRSDSPFVIKEGDAYRMWHRDYYEPACGQWSGYVSHTTSTDGINWDSHQKVLSAQGISGPQEDGYDINGISILKEEDQYIMWYAVHDCPSADPRYRPKIWRATSLDGVNWTNRQLSLPYIPYTWEYSVYDPHVVSDNCGGYVMYYTAYSDETGQQLAVATSTDGITWTNRQQIGAEGRAPFYVDVDGTPYLYFSKGDDIDEGYEIARMRGTKVGENQPPVAICQDVTVPTDSGECSAAAAVVDAGSYDPDGDPITLAQAPLGPYDLGTTSVTLTVTDDKDASDTCSATLEVVDQEPPTIESLVASPDTLWPANHKMVPVTVDVSVSDNCDTELNCQITEVAANEPEGTTSDWEITGALTVNLRAERSGSGNGRVYTITVECTDAAGNTTIGTVDVSVPHDQGKGKK